MDNEIESFLNTEEIELDEEISTAYKNNLSFKLKAVIAVLMTAAFVITSFFGLKLQGKTDTDEDYILHSTDIDITTLKTASDKYKIRVFGFPDEAGNNLRGQINITKDSLQKLSEDELNDFFNLINAQSDYCFITVMFTDDTGIIALPGNNNTYFYGVIDKYGIITSQLGTIIHSEENGYTYYKTSAEEIPSEITEASAEDFEPINSSDTVYITASGTKYHKDGCSYLSNSKVSVSLSKAISQGYTPCSRCIK